MTFERLKDLKASFNQNYQVLFFYEQTLHKQINPTLNLKNIKTEKTLFYKFFKYKESEDLEKNIYLSNEKIIYSEEDFK